MTKNMNFKIFLIFYIIIFYSQFCIRNENEISLNIIKILKSIFYVIHCIASTPDDGLMKGPKHVVALKS